MKATIHPYKGYLNTEFQLLSQFREPVSFVIKPKDGSACWVEGKLQPNVPQKIRMSRPGIYEVQFAEGPTLSFFVEDGYKFGGSEYKKSFVFDKCPWAFVVMHDRTYFHNRETEEEYVEVVSPDAIEEISKDFVLFKNNGQVEVTLFSLVDQEPVICISNVLFHNEYFIIWSVGGDNDSNELVIYSLNKREELFRDKYSHISIDEQNNRIYYDRGSQILSINITSNDDFVVTPLNMKGTFGTFAQTSYAVFVEDYPYKKDLVIYSLNTCSERGRIRVSENLARINDEILIDVIQRKNALDELDIKASGCPEAVITAKYSEYHIFPCEQDVFYKETIREISSGSRGFKNTCVLKSTNTELSETIDFHSLDVVITDRFFCIYGVNESVVVPINYRHLMQHKKAGNVLSHGKELILREDNAYTQISLNGFWDNCKEGDFDYLYFSEFGIVINKKTNEIINNKTLGHFKSYNGINGRVITDRALVYSGGRILWIPQASNLPKELSPKFRYGIELADNEIYLYENKGRYSGFTKIKRILSELYDSSKYMNVFLSDNGHQILYRDNQVFTMFDIETSKITEFDNLHFVRHINGTKPLFRIDESRQAILINPITGRPIDFDLISNYQFVSPNGELYADSKLKEYEEFYNQITNKIISEQEYNSLVEKYELSLSQWISDDYEAERVKITEARKDFISQHQDYFDNLPASEKSNLLTNLSFVSSFIKKRGVAIIRQVSTSKVVCRIPLGPPLGYINYAAFSYDNRFVALAGCYPLNPGGGLYLIYDLSNQVVLCQTMTANAVWSTAFNKNGALAAYTSSPVTFFAGAEQEYPESTNDGNIIKYYNFLSFSPDGTYFACSQQRYISYRKGNGEIRTNWGHQPSSTVSIRKTKNPQNELINFDDLSDFVSGRSVGIADTFNPQSVASVSFSNDNKRLMMVGSDGTVIIRNLHLANYASE